MDRYEELFTSEQILILRSEDLFQETEVTWVRLQQYLGLELCSLFGNVPRANVGEKVSEAVDASLQMRLRKDLKSTAEGVRERYGFGWDWA